MQQGGKEYLMRAHFGLPSVEAEDKEGKPPISVKFEIPYFTTSGIQVKHLHPTPTAQTWTNRSECVVVHSGAIAWSVSKSWSRTWMHKEKKKDKRFFKYGVKFPFMSYTRWNKGVWFTF